MQSTFKVKNETKAIRRLLAFFMFALAISGITAIPLEWELSILQRFFDPGTNIGGWIDHVYAGIKATEQRFPFLFYGYDWLAFAHFVLALVFIGPYNDPVRNKWVIEFGIYACLLIIPFALVAGHFRGIPFGWRFIDCMFGVIGIVPLLICYRKTLALEQLHLKINEI